MIEARLHEQEVREAVGVPGEGQLVLAGVSGPGDVRDSCLYWLRGEPTDDVREDFERSSGCIVLAPEGTGLVDQLPTCRVLEVSDPRAAIARVLEAVVALGRQQPWIDERSIAPDASISPHAVIEGNVRIAEGVVIEPFCFVGPDVSIGRGSHIASYVRILPRVAIGEETLVEAHSALGLEGSGFRRDDAGRLRRIPQLGGLVIGSNVEMGGFMAVEGGAIAPTVIEDHAKVGGGSLISHGVRIERGARIAGGVVFGGSSVIAADAYVGINATIREGRRVGARALVGMDVSVQTDVPDDAIARAPRPDVRERPAGDDPESIGFAPRSA